jgi:hypothetical protein
MASYTAAQLYGAGTLGENFTLNVPKTFTFNNPSGSSYFTLETIQDNNGTFTNRQTCAAGTWVAPTFANLIQTPFVASAVIQPGSTIITFTPSLTITGANYKLKGTGAFTLSIS